MFPSFISILDIQSWWEVPSIAHFCSLFRAAFNLLDFDIEELEEALLTDGTEDSGSSLLQELIVRLLCGCLANNDVSTFNYQMFLRRLFRQKCQEHGRYNPFNTDIDFQFLPLRTKVEILHALCDFRLDAEDVLDLLKNLEAESLRVEPLGYDDNESAYWYFYGTRLYREDYEKSTKKSKQNQKKTVWQVICFTEQDWTHLTSKFKSSNSKTEKALYRSLSENFLPEIPRLFQEKERQQRKRLLELQPRRTSSRVQKLREQHEEAVKSAALAEHEVAAPKPVTLSARELRAIQREASGSEGGSRAPSPAMPTQAPNAGTTSVGRQTNNSLASATGQILIQSVANTQRKKLKTSQVFRQTEEDLQTGMYKILDFVKNHDDAWPFIEPVEEDYAPNYYSIVRKPMDLQRMEDKLDAGEYLSYSRFKADFQLIVDNCRLYNGTDNEYTEMVDNLQQAFDRATDRFLDQITSSDEEIAVEFASSSKENAAGNKKNKRLKKENNKPTNKRKSSPTNTEKSESEERHKAKSRKSPVLSETASETRRKSRQTRKETSTNKTKPPEKPESVKSNTSSRNFKRVSTSPVVRNRSKSNCRSWTSSPSPPPPRIQKKKKYKDNKTTVSTTTNANDKQSEDKNKKWEALVSEAGKVKVTPLAVNKKTPLAVVKVEKERNCKLSETIEKLKKNSCSTKDLFEPTVEPKQNSQEKPKNTNRHKKDLVKSKDKKGKLTAKRHEVELDTESSNTKDSFTENKKTPAVKKAPVKKTGVIKNPAAIEALALATEQTLKDINKWLDDTPKFSEFSPSNDSPAPSVTTDEFDAVASKIENDYKASLKLTKPTTTKAKEPMKDASFKRRPPQKEFSKLHKRREIQRTIDRLQPGKSKGNLIANIQSNKVEEVGFLSGNISKLKDSKNSLLVKPDETAPKLSLGTVLDSFGQQHNFVDDVKEEPAVVEDEKPVIKEPDDVGVKPEEEVTVTEEKTLEVKENDVKPTVKTTPKQENVTPNLSAWFKAFGAPKSVSAPKKKTETEIEVVREAENIVSPVAVDERFNPKATHELPEDVKKSPMPSPATDISSCLPQPIPRTRKASTGSSVSERSSFSQDMTDPLDSPRLSLDERLGGYPAPYPSPLHRSPVAASPVMASPRLDDGQRSAPYPALNGNIRVGFYQDTVKSSPEKSCSPRDQPQSPHPQYSHVYIPPSSTYQYSNPQSCADPSPNHSPVYIQSQPPPSYSSTVNSPSYYESSKILKEYNSPKSTEAPFDNVQDEAHILNSKTNTHVDTSQNLKVPDPKVQPNTVIPVKKRLYNENVEVEPLAHRSSPHGIQNISRMHNPMEMGMFTNRDMELNLLSGRQLNMNTDQHFNKKSFLNTADAQPMESVSTAPKNYTVAQNTMSDVPFPVDKNVEDGRTIEMPRRGLNLQLSNAQPLNIPNPIKTIDLTGPDSPVYSRQTPITIPMEAGLQHSRLGKPTNMYERGEMPANTAMNEQMSQYVRQDNLSRTVQNTAKNVMSTDETVSNTSSPNSSQMMYNSRNMPLDMNLHHSRLNLGSADLRIPSVRNETLNSVAHSPLSIPNMGNQDLNSVNQRNDYAHSSIRSSLQSGINMSLSNTIPSSTYNTSSPSMGLDPSLGLRGNLSNLSHIVDRYQNDERLLASLPTAGSPFYPDKTMTSQSMFPKGIPTSLHSTAPSSVSSTLPMFSQPNPHINSPSTIGFHSSTMQPQIVKTTASPAANPVEKKSRRRKTKAPSPSISTENPALNPSNQGFQSYAGLKNNSLTTEPSAISLKTASVVPGSAFNFGPAPPGLGLYNDKDGYGSFIDEYRNPATNYYMAAAAAVHQRSTPEVSTEKSQRSTPQANPSGGSYSFLTHPQSRPPAYPGLPPPFMNPHQAPLMDSSSPLYQQYLQRHQEELLRHSGVLHQGLLAPPAGYPPGYPLGMRQPFDSINRPPWL